MFGCVFIPDSTRDYMTELKCCAGEFSSYLEFTDAQTVVFCLKKLVRLFDDASEIANLIYVQLCQAGIEGNVAIAQNVDLAILAARNIKGITILSAENVLTILGPLCLSALPISKANQEILSSWGIETLIEFLSLPETQAIERLGAEVSAVHGILRGLVERPMVLFQEEKPRQRSIEFEAPVVFIEALIFSLSRSLNDLCHELRAEGLALNRILIELGLETKEVWQKEISLPFPFRDAHQLLKIVELELAVQSFDAGIVSLRILVHPVPPQILQSNLFIQAIPLPEKLEYTVARIGALVGMENVGVPELIDSHEPRAYRLNPSARPGNNNVGEFSKNPQLRLGFRYFTPPRKVMVILDVCAQPQQLKMAGYTAKIISKSGPWRSSGNWWTQTAWEREDWEVVTKNGIYRIYYNRIDGWFAEGVYD